MYSPVEWQTATVKRSCPQLSFFWTCLEGYVFDNLLDATASPSMANDVIQGGMFNRYVNNLLEKTTSADVRVSGTRLRSNISC